MIRYCTVFFFISCMIFQALPDSLVKRTPSWLTMKPPAAYALATPGLQYWPRPLGRIMEFGWVLISSIEIRSAFSGATIRMASPCAPAWPAYTNALYSSGTSSSFAP